MRRVILISAVTAVLALSGAFLTTDSPWAPANRAAATGFDPATARLRRVVHVGRWTTSRPFTFE